MKSLLTLGESSSPSDVFDSVSFRGAQLASDDDMLPESLRGWRAGGAAALRAATRRWSFAKTVMSSTRVMSRRRARSRFLTCIRPAAAAI